MKVTITFELDLTNTSYNVDEVENIPICLQNLGSWLNKLHLTQLEHKCDTLCIKGLPPGLKEACLRVCDESISLSKQLFNNYKVEGVTEDNHTFVFTHQDPGYKETTLIDGVKTYIN